MNELMLCVGRYLKELYVYVLIRERKKADIFSGKNTLISVDKLTKIKMYAFLDFIFVKISTRI